MHPRLPGVEGLLQGLDAHGQPTPLPQAPPPKPSCSYEPLYLAQPLPMPLHSSRHNSPPRASAQNAEHRIASSLVSRTPRTFLHSSPTMMHSSPPLSRPQPQSAIHHHPHASSDADYLPTPRSPWSSGDSMCSEDMATDDSPTLRFPMHESSSHGAPVDYRARTHKLTCQFCHKTFRRPSTLRTHENVHTRELEFYCIYPNCGKTYNVRGNAYRHVRRAHEIANMIDARKYVVTAGSHAHSQPDRRNSMPS